MRGDFYQWTPETPPAAVSRQRPRRRRGGLLFLCTLLLLAGVTVSARLVLNRVGDPVFPPEYSENSNLPPEPAGEAPELERAPLGDGTTLSLAALPQGEPWTLQEIYRENLPSIVSIRGARQGSYSLGTGVIMSPDGYIITNSHVIEGCTGLDVVLWNDRSYSAALVGRDSQTDLAVLKIDCTGLTPAVFGDSSFLEVGDRVAAIGNPLGEDLRGTMTDGIISAINRDVVVEGRTMTLIQTNAALNSGNSGGALINEFGQVIGITNLKMQSYSTPVEGLGFAIPTATVKTIVDTLIAQGVVGGRPTIGITASTLTAQQAEAYGSPRGVWVASVEEKSDAWAKGLRPGDVIVQANGTPVSTMEDLQAVKEALPVGGILSLRFWREGNYQTADVVLVEQYSLEE